MEGNLPRPGMAILSTVSPADTARLGMLFAYATTAYEMNYDVVVFLALDSVLLVKKDVFQKLDGNVREEFMKARKMGVKFIACALAVQKFNVKEFIDDKIEVWEISSFFDFASKSKLTLSI